MSRTTPAAEGSIADMGVLQFVRHCTHWLGPAAPLNACLGVSGMPTGAFFRRPRWGAEECMVQTAHSAPTPTAAALME